MIYKKNRAWIEIDLNNLKYNINSIKKTIAKNTKIMAVVKANATGHGSTLIANYLSKLGIEDFAVATLEEGIELRQNDLKGNILILGYTEVENLKYVRKYDLIQTITDYSYFCQIDEVLDHKIKCHIKINTGMNRLGIDHDNIEELQRVYESRKLDILGTYSHFCVADSPKKEDIEFSKNQIKKFDKCIEELRKRGYDPGKIHIQGSYGITNFHLNYDFVRIGIFMYGCNTSEESYQKTAIDLKPILTLKSKITSIRTISKGESVSYGRNYIAPKDMKIAIVSIGYADGLPRCLSKNTQVKVNGSYTEIIGNICMDQLIIDIDEISASIGDEVIFIDSDDENLSALKMATNANTITTELLSRLGSRLPRISKSKK